MWKSILLLVSISCTRGSPKWRQLDNLKSTTPPDQQAAAVVQLIERLVGIRSEEFRVLIDPSLGPFDRDTYRLESEAGKIVIIGSSGVGASLGFHNYIKEWTGCHVSWSGSQLNLPTPLPEIKTPVQVSTNDRFRYYQNVCTVSYSSVWWNWERWSWEIDWMALNGINLPLAFTGQEALWRRIYLRFNFTQQDLNDFFSGPAFLAWQRMGNLDAWAGPLTESWEEEQLDLQHRILQRMRSLGMISVLPAFSGHVPRAITRVYPHVNVTELPSPWGGFNATFLLNPEETLFKKIGNAFIEEMEKEFGVDHVYNCDVFNEMVPSSGDPDYLRRVGEAVFEGMKGADEEAVWLMQGWLFYNPFWTPERAEALLTSVPLGSMIVLDLQAELAPFYAKFDSFYGQPFIWCMLHNFGGVLGMYGVVESINKNPFLARVYPNSTMVGVGLTMEGIEQNDVMYELMNEMAWRNQSVDLERWFIDYSWRRYGKKEIKAGRAWTRLMRSVYNCTDGHKQHGGYVVVKRPSLRLVPPLWYSVKDLLGAWDDLLTLSERLNDSSTYRYDLVDVTRESLQTLANQFYSRLVDGYKWKNKTVVFVASYKLLQLLNDLDEVLATDQHFLLGRWLEDAKSKGNGSKEMAALEYNARNQITLWGPTGNIRDYAAKQWSGMMKSFYMQRWKLFTTMIFSSLVNKKPFKQSEFNDRAFTDIEQPFTFDRSVFPSNATGDTIQVVSKIYAKWRNQADYKRLNKIQRLRSKVVKKSVKDDEYFSYIVD